MPSQDTRNKLRKDHPDSWIWTKPGDQLEGTVTDVTIATSAVREHNGGMYPLLRVEVARAGGYEPGQTLAVHALSTVLEDRILTHDPAPGERIVIRYDGTGEKKVAGRNPPELYTLTLPDRDPVVQAARVYETLRRSRGGNSAGLGRVSADGEILETSQP
jgi:hypothetical protein